MDIKKAIISLYNWLRKSEQFETYGLSTSDVISLSRNMYASKEILAQFDSANMSKICFGVSRMLDGYDYEKVLNIINNSYIIHIAYVEDITDEIIECGYCRGSGENTCMECDGDGWEYCNHCHGDGQEDCGECYGSGEINGESCNNCNGSGEEDCNRCGGGGEEACGSCLGTGYVNCIECGGEGENETGEDLIDSRLELWITDNIELIEDLQNRPEDESIPDIHQLFDEYENIPEMLTSKTESENINDFKHATQFNGKFNIDDAIILGIKNVDDSKKVLWSYFTDQGFRFKTYYH